MKDIIENLLLVTFGGIIGSYITARFEKIKAWRSYMIVRAEADRNLRLLEIFQKKITPHYSSKNDQQEQIDQLMDSYPDSIPVRILLLLREKMPIWSYSAWESRLPLLAQILSESQTRKYFAMQVDLERLSSIHACLTGLYVANQETMKDRAIELFDEWESIATKRQNDGNPFLKFTWRTRIASFFGFHWIS